MPILEEQEAELQLLGFFYRLATEGVDRRGAMSPVNHATGLPESPEGLVPRHQAVTGPKLALGFYLLPRSAAAAIIRREIPDPDNPGKKSHVGLVSYPEGQWTLDELDAVNHLELQLKRTVHRMADRTQAWVVHPDAWEGELPVGDDGLCSAVKITPQGLNEAFRRIPGTRYARGPMTVEEDLPKDVWRQAPQWAQQEAKSGAVQ